MLPMFFQRYGRYYRRSSSVGTVRRWQKLARSIFVSPLSPLFQYSHKSAFVRFQFTPEQAAYHKKIFEQIAARVGMNDLNGWYRMTDDDLFRREGPFTPLPCARGRSDSPIFSRLLEAWEVLQKYGNLIRALQGIFPEHHWQPWRFTRIPEGWWNFMPHQREFFDWLRVPLGLKDMDGWYNISYKEVRRQPGGYLLFTHYQDNVKSALLKIYPDHPWDIPRFDQSPQAYWDSLAGPEPPSDGPTRSPESQIRSYMEHIANELDVHRADDWYRISRIQLRKVGAAHVVKKYGGIVSLLKRVYPLHRWSEAKFVTAGKKSTQRALRLRLEEIFAGREIIEEYRPTPSALGMGKGFPAGVELDIYVPSVRLAFEFQGAQHYMDVFTYGQGTQGTERDPEKTAVCLKAGITLISVPFWWDTERESLENTIHMHRPDVIPKPVGSGDPIPDTPPPGAPLSG